MNKAQTTQQAERFAQLCEEEWPRLLRLCVAVSGAPDVAEDLAQEALLEAWRLQDRLSDWAGAGRWLAAIARYVCLRWRRKQGHEYAQHAHAEILEQIADTADLAQQAEDAELHTLLEQGLDRLPAEQRQLLIEKYVLEHSHTAIGAKRSLSEGAVAMRLQRAKQALRTIFTQELGHTARGYAPLATAEEAWSTTRIYCPWCGEATIEYRRTNDGLLIFRCSHCAGAISQQLASTFYRSAELKSPKVILQHTLAHLHEHYTAGLASRSLHCNRCGRNNPVNIYSEGQRIYVRCAHCELEEHTQLAHLAIDHPATLKFWQKYPRMRMLPLQRQEFAGQAALLVRFIDRRETEALDLIVARDSFAFLHSERYVPKPLELRTAQASEVRPC